MEQDSTTVEVARRGEVTVVAIGGRLSAVTSVGVRERLAALVDGAARFVIDLADLEWIDSSGVGALISLYKRARSEGGDVAVARLQSQPREIFRLLRLEAAFRCYETVDEAVAGAPPAE